GHGRRHPRFAAGGVHFHVPAALLRGRAHRRCREIEAQQKHQARPAMRRSGTVALLPQWQIQGTETMNGLKDKVALITGAAGDIGHGIARALLDRGARVHLTDIEADRLAGRAAALAAGDAVTTTAGDLADPGAIEAIASAALADHGR